MNRPVPYLKTENLAIGYKSKGLTKVISKGLNLELTSGRLVCLLGSNGSGKSTLMRTLAGLQPALGGRVFIDHQPLTTLSPEILAQKLSLVLTERIEVGNLTAKEVIDLGRTPYTNWFGQLDQTDKRKIDEAVAFADVSALLGKRIYQLSDGERQKVMLARALAQDTNLILLDEPTAHLDLPSRIEIMNLLHSLAKQTGKAILLSTHELDLALQTADYVWLLNHEGELITGVPEDLVLNGSFESAFSKSGLYFDKISGTFTAQTAPGADSINVFGDEELVLWTKKALKREGYNLSGSGNARLTILAHREDQLPVWRFENNPSYEKMTSIEDLIRQIRQN